MSVTEKELIEAFEAAYEDAFGHAEGMAAAARKAAELLGVELADPKPEPGVYLCEEGHIGFVDYEGDFHILNLTGKFYKAPTLQRDMAVYGARPARVVPAEPVQLDEDAYAALWGAAIDLPLTLREVPWGSAGYTARLTFRSGVDAALAKYGHGVA